MHLLRTIRAFFREDEIARALIALGECVGGIKRIVVVGGALRELSLAQLCSAKPEIPDIDVAVLTDFDTRDVMKRLGYETCTTNSFGGIRWNNRASVPLDIWSARSWAKRIGKPMRSEYSVHEIKGFLDFNINTGIYSPDGYEVDVEVIRGAIKGRMLELHNSLVPPDSVQLARIIKLERRVKHLGLDLGPNIYRYVIRVIESLDSATFAESKAYFERKSGHLAETSGAYFETRISQLASEQTGAMAVGGQKGTTIRKGRG